MSVLSDAEVLFVVCVANGCVKILTTNLPRIFAQYIKIVASIVIHTTKTLRLQGKFFEKVEGEKRFNENLLGLYFCAF